MARISKRIASAKTQQRLAAVITQIGADAAQPSPERLTSAYGAIVLSAMRPAIINALRYMAGGSAGFDYGPVGLTLLRWITINRLAGTINPVETWQNAQSASVLAGAQSAAASLPPAPAAQPVSVAPAAPVAAPVIGASAAPVLPSVPVAPVSVPVAEAAPFAEIAEEIVAEAKAQGAKVAVYVSPAEKAHPEWDWKPASKVFGVRGLRGNVAVWPRAGEPEAHPRTPDVNATYSWPKDTLQWAVFAAGESPAKGCWFWGNRGTGKTEFARQFAAQTGRPFYGVTFSKTMEPMDFIGSDGAHGGNSVWRDGTVLQGLRCATPAIIMFDEMSYGQSSHISGPLNEIVHPACTFNVPSTGERVRFSDGHMFIAADNTNGTGDSTNMYAGTGTVNRATMDRFAFFRRFTYLPKAQEMKMLETQTGCGDEIATKVWGILDALRKKVDSGLLSDPPSTREALALCCALRAGFDEKDAFETCFVGKYAEESQEEMRVTFVAMFNATPGEASDE